VGLDPVADVVSTTLLRARETAAAVPGAAPVELEPA